MAGQLVKGRLIERAQGQHRSRAFRNLRVASIPDKMNGDVSLASKVSEAVKVGGFWGFHADFLLTFGQPGFDMLG